MDTFERARLSAVMVGFFLLLYTLSPGAASAEGSCPDIKFFGAHGANEDGPGVVGDRYSGVGETVWNIWQEFSKRPDIPGSRVIEAVDFPKSPVEIPVQDVVTFASQIQGLEPGADVAAAALAEQVFDTYVACGDETDYVLVGYSQGAWAIDKALRQGLAPAPLRSSVEAQVSAILLLGDPVFPIGEPHADRMGFARWWLDPPTLGWDISDPYVPTQFADRFISTCVSYAGDVYDPICWFNGDLGTVQPNLWAHFTYKDHPAVFVDWLTPLVSR